VINHIATDSTKIHVKQSILVSYRCFNNEAVKEHSKIIKLLPYHQPVTSSEGSQHWKHLLKHKAEAYKHAWLNLQYTMPFMYFTLADKKYTFLLMEFTLWVPDFKTLSPW